MSFLARRALAMGVLFLLSPVWLFPLINWLSVYLANRTALRRPISFTEFDFQCVMTEFGTTHYLYVIGVWITCFAVLLYGADFLSKKMRKRA
jgi:hypothetical protein